MFELKKAIVFVFLVSCSSNPTDNPDHNVTLNCIYPVDTLSPLINSAVVKVRSSEGITLVDSVIIVESGASDGTLSIDLNVEPGIERSFRVSLLDVETRPLFWSVMTADISQNDYQSLNLSLSQSGFGSALSVIIFRDLLPWDSHALDSALAEVGESSALPLLGQYAADTDSYLVITSFENDPSADQEVKKRV